MRLRHRELLALPDADPLERTVDAECSTVVDDKPQSGEPLRLLGSFVQPTFIHQLVVEQLFQREVGILRIEGCRAVKFYTEIHITRDAHGDGREKWLKLRRQVVRTKFLPHRRSNAFDGGGALARKESSASIVGVRSLRSGSDFRARYHRIAVRYSNS